MFTAIERFSADRDYMEIPGKSCCSTGIRISVTLYQTGESKYYLIRQHYTTANLCGLTPTCGESISDFTQEYDNLYEAQSEFSTQGVKAYTQQFVWYTNHAEEIKELNSEHRTTPLD